MNSSLNYKPMTEEKLRYLAPSVFATQPWERMSQKYAFIPTIEIVRKMAAEGFQPVAATQSRTRIEGKEAFTKHMIRFRQVNASPVLPELGMLIPELILTNSHDGASAYVLDGGIFRYVCTNGLMVEDSTISKIRVTHKGGSAAADAVIEASYQVVDEFPKILDAAKTFGGLQLTAPQQNAFATAALSLRYDEQAPVSAERVLTPHRSADRNPNLWNTYNVVQENLVNGGIATRNEETGRRSRTRAVQGITESSKLNKALWVLTQEMSKLVTQS